MSLVAMASPALSSSFKSFEFEYYKPDACNSDSLSAVIISKKQHCYDLNTPAKSFHISGPSSSEQIHAGCTLYGYADAGCRGSINVEISGPSNADTCYTVGSNMGARNPARSVILRC